MCGIAGFLIKSSHFKNYKKILSSMADTIIHRGPDDEGNWYDESSGIGLAHRRLSILDLSAAGHQPMTSFSGRYVIVYNGEIYNYIDIQKELEDKRIEWKGHSDIEVILEAIDTWGLDEAVKKFNGMFAFAVWDKKEQVLSFCRDRLGIKPFYYARVKQGIIFGSELKAVKIHPDFVREIDRDALTLFLRHNCIPTPFTIYKNTWKLYPGHILKIHLEDLSAYKELSEPYCFWNARNITENCQENIFQGSDEDGIEQLDLLLRDSVKKRMISDVPLGAFLSGGIDSSTIVALMQVQSSRPIKTFSIGFNEEGYNEAIYAKAVANHLKTDHTELYVSQKQAMDVIPELPYYYDEPFSDSSQIPTILVSKLARRHVTVSLSGDGGDELFGGYNRHVWIPDIWNKIGWTPFFIRKMIAGGLQVLSPVMWNELFYKINRLLPDNKKLGRVGDNFKKLSEIIPLKSPEMMYVWLLSHWKSPEKIVTVGNEPKTKITNPEYMAKFDQLSHQMMYLDLITYLPDDILTKIDRATMSVGLEGRVPFLDHRVVEFAWSLPLSMKIKKNCGKWILRRLLNKYVPQKLIDRHKMGFTIPFDSWLRNDLRDWAESLIDETRLRQEGFFNVQSIRKKWDEHLSGKQNWQHHLWDVLLFQAWLEKE